MFLASESGILVVVLLSNCSSRHSFHAEAVYKRYLYLYLFAPSFQYTYGSQHVTLFHCCVGSACGFPLL